MKSSTAKTLKVTFMAISGIALIGYFALGEWNERRAEAAKAANAVTLENYRKTLQPLDIP